MGGGVYATWHGEQPQRRRRRATSPAPDRRKVAMRCSSPPPTAHARWPCSCSPKARSCSHAVGSRTAPCMARTWAAAVATRGVYSGPYARDQFSSTSVASKGLRMRVVQTSSKAADTAGNDVPLLLPLLLKMDPLVSVLLDSVESTESMEYPRGRSNAKDGGRFAVLYDTWLPMVFAEIGCERHNFSDDS